MNNIPPTSTMSTEALKAEQTVLWLDPWNPQHADRRAAVDVELIVRLVYGENYPRDAAGKIVLEEPPHRFTQLVVE